MAFDNNDSHGTQRVESCIDCLSETPHRVTIELRTESPTNDNAVFSREPYRVSRCLMCETTTSQRMNNG